MSRANSIGVIGCLGVAFMIGCVDPAAPDVADKAAQSLPPAQTDAVSEQATADVVSSEYTLHWCDAASPAVAVSKSIQCESCSQNDAEDCARKWAFIVAENFCDASISTSGGAAACSPFDYDGGTCVDTNSSTGITSSVQFGSDTACGTWPFRHAKWRVVYKVSGSCGYPCSELIST
jgi:hypothetical protein